MPCVLTVCTTFEADYDAPIGSTVTIDIDSSTDTAILVFARYNGVSKTSAPWTFPIVAGVKTLAYVAESSTPGDRINLLEVCGGGKTNVLRSFFYSPTSSPDSLAVQGL